MPHLFARNTGTMMKVGEAPPYGFEDTSFQAAGGVAGIQKLANAFYKIMQTLPEAQPLLALHRDIPLAKEKLGRFICGWLGGPKKYQEKFGPINIPNAHQQLPITAEHAELWLKCMDLAIDRQPYSEKFAAYLKAQFRVPVQRILEARASQQ